MLNRNACALAGFAAIAISALACNFSKSVSGGDLRSAPSEGEMGLAEAMQVEPEDRRPEVLEQMGAPDAFTLHWETLEGETVRWEEWSYFDTGARFDFVDGELAWTVDLDPAPDGSLYAHLYNPLDFAPTMTADDVRSMFSDQVLEEISLAEAEIPAGLALAGDQILFGFDNDQLVFVQTFVLNPSPDPLAPPLAPEAGTPLAGRETPEATEASGEILLSDDFDEPSLAQPLFGPEFMTYHIDGGEGALTSLAPQGVVPVMYGTDLPADLSAEVDIRFPQANEGSAAGLVLRSDDTAGGLDYYYHLRLSPADREVKLEVWKDGVWSTVETASLDADVMDPSDVIHLQVEARGNRFRVLLNGDLMLDAADAQLTAPGIFGLSLTAAEVPVTVYFDNLRIEGLEE